MNESNTGSTGDGQDYTSSKCMRHRAAAKPPNDGGYCYCSWEEGSWHRASLPPSHPLQLRAREKAGSSQGLLSPFPAPVPSSPLLLSFLLGPSWELEASSLVHRERAVQLSHLPGLISPETVLTLLRHPPTYAETSPAAGDLI